MNKLKEEYDAFDNCPFKVTLEEWDDDDGDITALLCEGCPNRGECSR